MARDTEVFRPTLETIPSAATCPYVFDEDRFSSSTMSPISPVDTPPSTPTSSADSSTFSSSHNGSKTMKKRFSDSITDMFALSLHRRRPSLQQGPTPSRTSSNVGSSKSRNRSSSATAAGTSYLRNIPTLNSSASMATIASTSSTSSRGGLIRRDSSTDVARVFPQPPTGVGVSKENPIGDSPTVPVLEPGRTMASRKIMTTEELREEDEDHVGGLDMEDWRTGFEDGNRAAQRAAADVGMRRMTGITRKISDSKRIRPPSPGDTEEDVGGSNSLAEELEHRVAMARDQLGIPGGKRESSMSASASTIQGYTSSSDEASTSSSLRSVGSRSRSSTSGASSKAGLPQTMSFAHSKKRGSKSQNPPPPLDLHGQLDNRSSIASTSAVLMLDKQPASRPQTVPPARSATASPSKSLNMSIRHKQSGGLEVPGAIASPSSPGSRLSSLAGTSATQGPKSRSISTTALNSISRSDSSSSTATTPHTAKTNPTSTTPAGRTQKYLTQRDRQNSSKVSLAAYAANLARNKPKHPPSLEPPLPDPGMAPSVAQAPASGMYWYKAPTHGQENMPLRAHTCTLVGSSIYVFGGCDVKTCFNDLHVFDAGKSCNFIDYASF